MYKLASIQYRIFAKFFRFLPERIAINILYFRRFGNFPNIESPRTFNEKLQWRKLYDRDPGFVCLVDKLAVKDWVRERGTRDLRVPKVFWVGNELEQSDIARLPDAWVLKASHGSGTNYIKLPGEPVDIGKLNTLGKAWLKHDQSSVMVEWAYSKVTKKLFIEEYIDVGEVVPRDYKFFVFSGAVKCIQLDIGRFGGHTRNLFNKSWKDYGFRYTHDRMVPSPDAPKNLNKMVDIVEQMAAGFDFLRVDLYSDGVNIWFGEITLYPGAGYEPFDAIEVDRMFGDWWSLPSINERGEG